MQKKLEETGSPLAIQRLHEFLEALSREGYTQTQIATQAGLPPQYLSDIKRGRRPMTELLARRLETGWKASFQWLMGRSSCPDHPSPSSASASSEDELLPLFQHPIDGDPQTHPKWKGNFVRVPDTALAKLSFASRPYVLEFQRKDREGRLRKGDMILMSQQPNDRAAIQVVRHRKKSFLARQTKDGHWSRVANDTIYEKEFVNTSGMSFFETFDSLRVSDVCSTIYSGSHALRVSP